MNRRRRFALTLNLFAAALLAAALLSGCSDNGTEPEAPAQDTTSQADLLEDMLPATSLIEEGLFADPTETALAGTAPGSEQAVSSPIQPLRFWRNITDIRRSYEFAFADSDSAGRPLTAIVTIHKRLAGTFNIVPEPANEGDPRTVIRKELRDHWVRRVKLRRVRPKIDLEARDRWRVAAVSGVKVTSRDATSEIASVHVESGAIDTVITEPLAFFNLRRILRFDDGADVTLTVTTGRSDDVVLLYRSGHREKMANNGDNTYTATFPAGDLEGWRHFGVNALSHGTLYDDELPYDSKAWILPYVVASTPEVETIP
jgi:hypothetical protein